MLRLYRIWQRLSWPLIAAKKRYTTGYVLSSCAQAFLKLWNILWVSCATHTAAKKQSTSSNTYKRPCGIRKTGTVSRPTSMRVSPRVMQKARLICVCMRRRHSITTTTLDIQLDIQLRSINAPRITGRWVSPPAATRYPVPTTAECWPSYTPRGICFMHWVITHEPLRLSRMQS